MSSVGSVLDAARPQAGLPRMLGLLDQAVALLREAAAVPLDSDFRDGDLIGAVQRLDAVSGSAQGQKLALVAEISKRHAHKGHAAATTEDLLARTLHVSRGEAKAQTELANGLQAVPQVAEALRDGRIGLGQATVTVKKAEELKGHEDADALIAGLDTFAAREGQTLNRTQLAQQVDGFIHLHAADVLADREKRAWQRRGLWFTERDGLPGLEARLGVEGLAAVKAAVEALGRPEQAGDERSVAQRHADALVTLANKFLDDGELPQVATQRPHVLLVTTPDALHGTAGAEPSLLDGHGPVSNDLARQLCCDSEVTQVLTDRNGKVLDVGRTQRTATKKQREAVIARDKACIGCGAPVTRCEVHHIKWWRHEGRTDLDNLTLVCWGCHRHIHHENWQITRDTKGNYKAHPPDEHPPGQRLSTGEDTRSRSHPPERRHRH